MHITSKTRVCPNQVFRQAHVSQLSHTTPIYINLFTATCFDSKCEAYNFFLFQRL